jgi:hypothetical protein
MGLLDEGFSMSDAKEKYTPEDEKTVVVLQWDMRADPTSSDVCHPVNGYEDVDDLKLKRPRLDIDYYYLHESGEVFDIDDMINAEPSWYDGPDEIPEWYENEN